MPTATAVHANTTSKVAPAGHQETLSSARQWEIVALDVGTGICEIGSHCTNADTSAASGYKPAAVDVEAQGVCFSLNVGRDSDSPSTKFRQVFSGALIRQLIANQIKVYESAAPAARNCGIIKVRSTVVKLTGAQHTSYYAGEYTALAQGIVVVRNVARSLSEAAAVGTVALGEAAYFLSPNYLTRHPMAELTVAVSVIDTYGRYMAQYSNVYYIDARDQDAYGALTEENGAKDVSMQADLPYSRPEAPLPSLWSPDRSANKKPFSGIKEFSVAGARVAYLVGASFDGMIVIGNVAFQDNKWHVGKMSPSSPTVDLGTMGGVQARATSMSTDGAIVVGLVQMNPTLDQWSVFKWKSASGSDGSTTEILGRGAMYAGGSALDAYVSGDGSTVVATVETGPGGPHRLVLWSQDTSDDPLNAVVNKGVAADARLSCDVKEVAAGGTSVAFTCYDVADDAAHARSLYRYYTWTTEKKYDWPEPSKEKFAAVFQSSSDGKVIAVLDEHGQPLLFNLDGKQPGPPLDPAHFSLIGVSQDGRTALGGGVGGALLWAAAATAPVLVYSAPAVPAGGCAAAVGDYVNGTVLLVNAAKDPGSCGLRYGQSAYVLAPP